MIIKAKHHFILYPFFKGLSLWLIHRHFSSVLLKGEFIDRGRPVLLLANHTSWWDGFWAMYINIKVLKRKFHFMMLEEQLRKFWFFNYSGGYSVQKKSRSLLESLAYTADLLKENQNMVLIFPQGKLYSAHQQKLQFQPGIEKILSYSDKPVQILFMASFTDYLSSKKPGLYLYLKEYEGNSSLISDLELAYNSFYGACVEQQSNLSE